MGVIVLKHLAREFDMDPFRLRQVLRKEFGYAAGRRWRWDEKADAGELKMVREFLAGRKGGGQPKPSSSDTATSSPAKSSGRKSPKARSGSQKVDGSSDIDQAIASEVTIARSGARKSSSGYTAVLRESVKAGDDFIAGVIEKRKRLAAVKDDVGGEGTTARQKLSKAKRKMRDVAKSGDSPKPKK